MRKVSPAASVPALVNRYLLPQERSCITVRMHPAVLARPLILVSGLVFGGLVAARKRTSRSVRPEIVWGAPVSVLLYFLYRVAAWRVAYFTVTNKRMILVSGLVVRKVAMMPLVKVTDMSFQRSAMGRVFGYGEFIVESAEQEQALRSVNFLPYPEQLYLEVCGLLFPDPAAEAQQDQDQLPDSPG
jgi:membrane protein YdbS with pleckstrin-like domain